MKINVALQMQNFQSLYFKWIKHNQYELHTIVSNKEWNEIDKLLYDIWKLDDFDVQYGEWIFKCIGRSRTYLNNELSIIELTLTDMKPFDDSKLPIETYISPNTGNEAYVRMVLENLDFDELTYILLGYSLR